MGEQSECWGKKGRKKEKRQGKDKKGGWGRNIWAQVRVRSKIFILQLYCLRRNKYILKPEAKKAVWKNKGRG